MASRILLVDDERRNRVLLETHLRPLGHEIIHAIDGPTGLASFDEFRPHLVLLDYMMPGIDGVEVLRRIRLRPDGAHVPVVLVTAHSDREHRLLGIRAGADEFLEKPIDGAILIARVGTLLALKDSRDELERRHRALEDAQREQRELTAFIVHDLKNPLSVVCGGLEWAEGQVLPSQTELAEALADVSQAAARLTSMIGDLLAISQMEDATFPLRFESVSVSTLLETVVHSYSRRADERGIALAPRSKEGLEVQADRTLLRRVIENILDNAFRYTPPRGRISIDARPWHGVEITISNDGPAIPVSERRLIFEKFRRGPGESTGTGNAGLGLYFCKRVVEAHGGAIDVVETTEWPTSFLISLPGTEPMHE